MNVPRDPRRKRPRQSLAPSVIRNLESVSTVYRAVLKDALELIETAAAENAALMIAYDNLTAIVKVALDGRALGSVPSILRACNVLLGESGE